MNSDMKGSTAQIERTSSSGSSPGIHSLPIQPVHVRSPTTRLVNNGNTQYISASPERITLAQMENKSMNGNQNFKNTDVKQVCGETEVNGCLLSRNQFVPIHPAPTTADRCQAPLQITMGSMHMVPRGNIAYYSPVHQCNSPHLYRNIGSGNLLNLQQNQQKCSTSWQRSNTSPRVPGLSPCYPHKLSPLCHQDVVNQPQRRIEKPKYTYSRKGKSSAQVPEVQNRSLTTQGNKSNQIFWIMKKQDSSKSKKSEGEKNVLPTKQISSTTLDETGDSIKAEVGDVEPWMNIGCFVDIGEDAIADSDRIDVKIQVAACEAADREKEEGDKNIEDDDCYLSFYTDSKDENEKEPCDDVDGYMIDALEVIGTKASLHVANENDAENCNRDSEAGIKDINTDESSKTNKDILDADVKINTESNLKPPNKDSKGHCESNQESKKKEEVDKPKLNSDMNIWMNISKDVNIDVLSDYIEDDVTEHLGVNTDSFVSGMGLLHHKTAKVKMNFIPLITDVEMVFNGNEQCYPAKINSYLCRLITSLSSSFLLLDNVMKLAQSQKSNASVIQDFLPNMNDLKETESSMNSFMHEIINGINNIAGTIQGILFQAGENMKGIAGNQGTSIRNQSWYLDPVEFIASIHSRVGRESRADLMLTTHHVKTHTTTRRDDKVSDKHNHDSSKSKSNVRTSGISSEPESTKCKSQYSKSSDDHKTHIRKKSSHGKKFQEKKDTLGTEKNTDKALPKIFTKIKSPRGTVYREIVTPTDFTKQIDFSSDSSKKHGHKKHHSHKYHNHQSGKRKDEENAKRKRQETNSVEKPVNKLRCDKVSPAIENKNGKSKISDHDEPEKIRKDKRNELFDVIDVVTVNPEVIGPKHTRGMVEKEECLKIIDYLYNDPRSDPFRKEIKSATVPDYHKIVKFPMCFDQVASKLRRGIYQNVDHFVADVRRIFWNCRLYNTQEDSQIRRMCATIEKKFNKQLRKLFPHKDFFSITGSPPHVSKSMSAKIEPAKPIHISRELKNLMG